MPLKGKKIKVKRLNMERFTLWRDATGLTFGKIIYRAIGFLLACIRIPLFMAVMFAWILLFFAIWIPNHCFSGHLRPIVRLIDIVMGHACLFVCGFLYVPKRKMTFRPGSDTLSLAKDTVSLAKDEIHPGDLIICNAQSPIDIIYLCTRFSPIFTIVDAESGKVVACSRWTKLFDHAKVSTVKTENSSIEKIVKSAHAPIIVFPEGSTSNGRAILSFIADLTTLPSNQRMHLMNFKYFSSDGGFLPTLSVAGRFGLLEFFVKLCQQWYNSLTVKWIDSKSIYSSSNVAMPTDDNFTKSLANVMCSLSHCRSVNLDAKDKRAFIKAYFNQ